MWPYLAILISWIICSILSFFFLRKVVREIVVKLFENQWAWYDLTFCIGMSFLGPISLAVSLFYLYFFAENKK